MEFTFVSKDVADFAKACGELMNAEIGSEPGDFTTWAITLLDVEAPPVMADFWDARQSQHLYQLELQGDEIIEVGPNAETQRAYDDEQWLIYNMEPEIRDTLVNGGCLTDIDVRLAESAVAAYNRLLDGRGQGEGVSVTEFALACADIKVTAPTFDTLEALPVHMAYWWEKLNPPLKLLGYHEAIGAFYDAWIESGVTDPEDVDVLVLLELSEAVKAMDPDDVETLAVLGCSG